MWTSSALLILQVDLDKPSVSIPGESECDLNACECQPQMFGGQMRYTFARQLHDHEAESAGEAYAAASKR